MLIPSIDLKGGAVVQLVQGERLAIKDDDVFRWVRRFEHFPKVQVIDLDAAMGTGDNLAIVGRIAGALPCRVGGGIRTVDRARGVLDSGARQIIAGSALFTSNIFTAPSGAAYSPVSINTGNVVLSPGQQCTIPPNTRSYKFETAARNSGQCRLRASRSTWAGSSTPST